MLSSSVRGTRRYHDRGDHWGSENCKPVAKPKAVAGQTRGLLTCGPQSGRTSAPIIPHRVQTMRRHKERTGVASESQSAFMLAL